VSDAGVREFDHVIIGAGSAGCVLAARLTEDRGCKVLLLEAGGPEHRHRLMKMPLAWRDTFMDPQLGWGYSSEPEPFADDRSIPVARGKVLGGSSSVNGMMYQRGHPGDYDGWCMSGLPGWSYADVLPYFKRSENNWRGETTYHGGSGPLTVARHATDDVIYPRLIETAERLGYAHLDDFHAERAEGFTAPEFNVHRGKRASTAARFLRPAMRRRNLTVETDALAHRVVLEHGRAVAVSYEHGGEIREARARGEIILCGGAFNSPQLLLLSGIGPAEELGRAGVAVAHDLPGVGRNLQDHQSIGLVFEAKGAITFESQLRWDRLARHVLLWQLFGTGAVAALPVAAQGFYRTRPGLSWPDAQFLISPVAMTARPWFPFWREGAGHRFSLANVLLHPQSRGSVTLRSPNPRDPPRILFNLLQAAEDRASLRAMISFARRFFATAPASELVARELMPGPEVRSEEEMDDYLRRMVGTAMHPSSTCAMGTDETAVVDAQLRVRGLEGLRVADASVMPTIPGGNTNAPVIMIAEKAADLVRGRVPPPRALL
jgi:choline dehydrogenase